MASRPDGVLPVPELPRPGAEVVAQLALGRLHVRVRLVVVDRQSFQRGASAGLGRVAGLDDHALQFVPQFACECQPLFLSTSCST